jgi:hypothetical protein
MRWFFDHPIYRKSIVDLNLFILGRKWEIGSSLCRSVYSYHMLIFNEEFSPKLNFIPRILLSAQALNFISVFRDDFL